MAFKTAYLVSSLLLFIPFWEMKAQSLSEEKDRQIEQILESAGEAENGENENSQLLDDLTRFSENPLNINTAEANDLEQLHLLDIRQIYEILDYRTKYGFFLSPYELNSIQSLTPGVISSMIPFVRFDQPDRLNQNRKAYQKLILRAKTSFPIARGYRSISENKPAAYPGFPVSLYSRYQFEVPKKLQFGWIADQDAGEPFFRKTNREGFDYYSGFFSYQSKSFVQQITLGDYYLKIGQGLNFWSGSGIGKSGNTINILKTGQGIRPYTSSDENLYFRGIAAVLGKGSLQTMLFYSQKHRDANLNVDKSTGDTVFTSLKTGGYHRTKAEIEDENAVREQEIGAYTEWSGNHFKVGGLFCHQNFNLNMIRGTSTYKAQSFSGNENLNIGLDYQLALRKIQLFGEAAMSLNQKPAFIQGIIWHAHPQLNCSFSFRYFDPGFHSFYGNPLSEGSEAKNEKGIYTGIEIYPLKKIKISGYADFYHFPFPTYSTTAPSSGRDFLIQLESSLSRKFFFYLRGKFESKPQKYTQGTGDPFDYEESTKKLRLHTEWKSSGNFSIRNRVELVSYSFYQTSEMGYLVYQDLEFELFKKVNIWSRYAYFHTNGYNSRIYTYENDLLYSFSFPEFHGIGHRIYLNLKWQPTKKMDLYFKTGQTIHSKENSWGNGNDKTSGNKRTEVRGELYFRF